MQGTHIVNVHADIPDCKQVLGRIDPKIFKYFFQGCLVGDRGPRQAFITFFFQRFYEACLAEGIKPIWDEEIEGRINTVLQRMNFQALPEPKVRRKVVK